MNEILEQIKDNCDCIPVDMKDEEILSTIEEVISLISFMTCWTTKPCETLLKSKRTEIIKMDEFLPCSCDDGIMEIDLYFKPVEATSIKVYSVHREGVKEITTELSDNEISYSTIKDLLYVDIRNHAIIQGDCCVCKQEQYLMIEYIAGFELIPNCLLPLVCDLFHIVYDKNKCCCDKCVSCNMDNSDSGYYDTGNIDISNEIANVLTSLITNVYTKQLSLISVCKLNCNNVWGVKA